MDGRVPNIIHPTGPAGIKIDDDGSKDRDGNNAPVQQAIATNGSLDVSVPVLSNPSNYVSPESFLDLFKISGTLNELIFKELPQITNFHFHVFGRSGRLNKFESVSVLNISLCPNISDFGIELIAILFPRLKKLDATGCHLLSENSLRFVASKYKNIETATFDMTSVRFVPTTASDLSKFSVKNCPLMNCTSLPEPLLQMPSACTIANIIIYKTMEMRDISLTAKLLGDPHYCAGSDATGCILYRVGSYSVVECVENTAMELLLSENCLLILPYDTALTVINQLHSVENRLKFVTSVIESLKAICVPVIETTKKEARHSKKLKSLKEILLHYLSGAAPPTTVQVARYRYFVENHFEFATDKSELLPWIDANKPADVPGVLSSDLLENAMRYFNEAHFSTVDSFIRAIGATSKKESKHCWASVVQFLVETGNLWREHFIGHDDPLPGPGHVVSSLSAIVNFISEFRSATDSTAMAEDIRCLPSITPLCSMSRIVSLLKSKDNSELPSDIRNRLLLEFEFVGLGIFRRKTAFSLASLSLEPVIGVEHFVLEFDQNAKTRPSFLVAVKYPIVCHPEIVLHRLLAVLAKVYPPALIWSSGAFFYDAFFLEVLVKTEAETSSIVVQFSADSVATRPGIRPAVEGSCSFIHTICCAVLNQFSPDDLTSGIRPSGIRFLSPGKISHTFCEEKFKSFSRLFDDEFPRCSKCLLDALFVSSLDRLVTGYLPNKCPAILRPTGGEKDSLIARLLLNDFGEHRSTPESSPAGFAFTSIAADILSLENVESFHIWPNSPQDCGEQLILNISEEMTTFPLRIEASRFSNGQVIVVASQSGMKLAEKMFDIQTKYVSIETKFRSSSKASLTFFHRNVLIEQNEQVSATDNNSVQRGMRLEARNLRYPHLICAANVRQTRTVGEKNEYLIHFDGWSDGYSFWTSLDNNNVFPCGFVEYLNKNPDKMASFKEATPKFSGALRTPRGSGLEEQSRAFNWHLYLSDLQEQLKISVEPLPFDAFEKKNLLGFPREFIWLKQCRNIPDVPVVGLLCAESYKSVMENVTKSYQHRSFMHSVLPFVPLSSTNLSWQLCVWPCREKLTDFSNLNLICGFPAMHHFVNVPPVKVVLPIKTMPAFAELIAVFIVRLLSQSRFFPDKNDVLFPNLQRSCPFAYSVLEKENFTEVIEHCFQDNLFPNLLDYLLVCSKPETIEPAPNNNTSSNSETLDKSFFSKAVSSRPLIEGVVSQSKLLFLMPQKEEGFFVRNESCPRLMCEQHLFHYIRYAEALSSNRGGDYRSELSTTGAPSSNRQMHDSLLTQVLFTKDEFSALKSSIATIHPHINELYLGRCSLTALPVETCSLRSLSELILVDNELANLPDQLKDLAGTLRRIDISENKFESLPPVVFTLKELVSLRADGMQLKSLDKNIGELRKLRILSLQNNSFAALPSELAMLDDLEILDLSGVTLPTLCDSLYYDNVVAFCRYNRIPMQTLNSFTKWSKSSGARSGWLDQDGVERLRAYFFEQVPRLTFEKSSIGFPVEIFSLKKLRDLSLANQAITVVPDEICQLHNLRRLNLTDCLKLETVSANVSVDSLEVLQLDGCSSLKTPPQEIRKRGMLAIMAYFRRLATGSVSCRRCKLMFVGLGGAGKTSLARAITSPSYTVDLSKGDVSITDGIDITNWRATNDSGDSAIDFRLWDFAGQVVYYNTHQFFLSSRAVYLVIWNMRLGYQHAGLDFWLSSIAVHAPSAPVLVVGTQADLVSQERSLLPEAAFRERFSSIRGFHYISNRTGSGIAELRKQTIEVALSQKHIGEHIPSAWISFEENLLKAGAGANNQPSASILMFNEVRKLADISGVFEEEETFEALQFLSDLGSIQFFRNEFLCDRVIINPQWIVDVLASLISVKKAVSIKDGVLEHKDIGLIWESYPPDLHQWLLKLTEAFDLTFPLKNKQASVVPCLLPDDVPSSFSWPGLDPSSNNRTRQMQLTFLFKYLPTGLFNRVQVRLCHFSDENTMWRMGSLLRKSDHIALILQSDSTTVHVKVQGPRPDNLTFLILEVFDTLINEAFQGVRPDYFFSCPECVNARVPEPSMFQRSKIQRATELHVPFMQCSEYFHCIPTQELRHLLPAESAVDFDCQLVRTVKQLTGLSDSLQNDCLIIGCPADNTGGSDLVTVNEFGENLSKEVKSLTISDPESLQFDQMAALLRSTRLVICCVSPSFMDNDRCQAALFCARETYRKQVLIAFLRDFDWKSHPSLAFLLGNDVFIRAVNRAKYQPNQVLETVKLRIEQSIALASIVEISTSGKTYPDVFISYCWQNSREAVEKGTRMTTGAVGVTDPRALKTFLTENGFNCWLDVEQAGRGTGALFENIALGLRHCRVVVVCISDEYCESENCLREFRFATSACGLPLVLCAVGTGLLWKQSEVTLVASLSARINFQIENKENYNALLSAVREHVPLKNENSAPKTQEKLSRDLVSQTTKEASVYFSEMLELAQRRFIRQLNCLVQGTKPYPRLVILDLIPISANAREVENLSTTDSNNVEDLIDSCQWCVRFFCEHESGWHLTENFLPVNFLNTNPGSQLLRQSAAYLSRVFSLVRYTHTVLPQLLAPNDPDRSVFCQNVVAMLEKLVKFEEPFTDEYVQFRNFAISLDKQSSFGGLQCCQLAIGKELWLCPDHRQSTYYRAKEVANKTTVEEIKESVPPEPEPSLEKAEKFSGRKAVLKRMVQPGQEDDLSENLMLEEEIGASSGLLKRPLTSTRTSRACCLQ